MRRAAVVLGLVLTAAGQSPGPPDDLLRRMVEFHQHYNPFSRALFGCPVGAKEVEECSPAHGVIDYAEYVKARKAAMKAFDLSEPRP